MPNKYAFLLRFPMLTALHISFVSQNWVDVKESANTYRIPFKLSGIKPVSELAYVMAGVFMQLFFSRTMQFFLILKRHINY